MRLWTKYFLVGALACWAPEIIIAAIARRPGEWQTANTFLPLTTFLAYWFVSKSRSRSEGGPSAAAVMLAGIYILGPWLIALEQTLIGSGFHEAGGPWYFLPLLILASFFPPYTLVMTTYDASLYALLAVTVFLNIAHFKWEKGRWILPVGKDRWNWRAVA